MTKKYCEYETCFLQSHEHYHIDEYTIRFSPNVLNKKINILSINVSLSDMKHYLTLSNDNWMFSCDVVSHKSPFTSVEISDHDLEELRKFLNEIKL